MTLSFSQVKNNSRRNEYIWNKHKVQEKNIVLFCCGTNIFECLKFRNFWNLKEFLKKVHYSSYFEGLFITWKNCFERTKHNISFFSFQRSWNGWIEVRLHFVRYFFTSVFLLSSSKLIIFFPERKVSDIIHASFQIELQGYKRLRKIDTNSRSFKK